MSWAGNIPPPFTAPSPSPEKGTRGKILNLIYLRTMQPTIKIGSLNELKYPNRIVWDKLVRSISI